MNLSHPPNHSGSCLPLSAAPQASHLGKAGREARQLLLAPTLSLRKPILRMFSTLGTPSAIVRSPMESPSKMMLVLVLSCWKYSVPCRTLLFLL